MDLVLNKNSIKKSHVVLDKLIVATLFVFVIFSLFSITITQIACGLGGFLWLLRTHLTDTWRQQRWPLGIPFLLFFLACLVAVVNAYDVSYSYESLKKCLEVLIFFWIINCVKDKGLRDSLSITLTLSATLAGLFGFYQAWRDGITLTTRLEGSLSVYMTFAGLLMMVGVLTLSRIMFHRSNQIWIWASFGIIFSCLLLTFTRQALFGFIIGLIFLLFIFKKKILWFLPALLLTIYLVSPLDNQIRLKAMLSGADQTFEVRTSLWIGGWEIFKDYPLTGCGFRCVDLLNNQYPDPSGYINKLRGMHNNFIQLAVDTGILGLSTWLGIWFYFFRFLFRKNSNLKGDSSENWIIFGSAAAVLAFLAGGLFESNLYDSEIAMVLYFIMALPFVSSGQELSVKQTSLESN